MAQCYAKHPPQTRTSVRTHFLVLSQGASKTRTRGGRAAYAVCDNDREVCSARSDEVEKVIGHVAGSEGRPVVEDRVCAYFFWLEAGLIEPIGVGPEPDPLGGKLPPFLLCQ